MPDLGNITPNFLKVFFQGFLRRKIKQSALSPFLNSCIFITIPCLVIAIFSEPPLVHYLCVFASVPILLFALAAIVFIFTDRDRLHTEEHLERKQVMDIAEAKGQGMLLNPVDLVDMVNPNPKTLSEKIDEEE